MADPISIDGAFHKWEIQYCKETGEDFQLDGKYARAAFEAGYKLAIKDFEFFTDLLSKRRSVVITKVT